MHEPEKDDEVARSYPRFHDKGPIVDGTRLTLMSGRRSYRADDDVRVHHVVEVVVPGRVLYAAGPKPVYGEFVDDVPTTPAPPDDPFAAGPYNDMVLPTPAVDDNYDITTYRFAEPGRHRIEWRLGPLRSNVLLVDIV
jgi:hypothetical protein